MDGTKGSISPHQLHQRLGTAQAPIVLDVRKPADFAASDRCIVSAVHRAPEDVARWSKELPAGRPVIVQNTGFPATPMKAPLIFGHVRAFNFQMSIFNC